MRMLRMFLVATVILVLPNVLFASNCEKLMTSSPPELVSFLDKVKIAQDNKECVAKAIEKLANQSYEPAIPVLLKFLDLRWPAGSHGRRNYLTRRAGVVPEYPAETALEKFGDKALSQVLGFLKSPGGPAAAVDSAVEVWMTAYKDNPVLGVALLKQEADKIKDPALKGNLAFAAYKAQRNWCPPEQRAQCRAAALVRVTNAQ